MLTKKIVLPMLAAAALLGAWQWWQSDAQRIARRVNTLTARIEKSPGEGQLVAALKSQEVALLFADPFQFRARPFDFETSDRQALIRAVALYRMRSDSIVPKVLDRQIDVDGPARRAAMVLTARFVGGLRGLGAEAYRFQIHWIEQQGEWKIEFVDLVEVFAGVSP